MKKFILLILALMIASSVFSVDSKKVSLNVEIPEDYNVVIPDGSAKLDRLVLELHLDAASDNSLNIGRTSSTSMLSSSSGLNITDSLFDSGMLRMTMLYYGNQSSDYRVNVSIDTGKGWGLGKSSYLPISASFKRNAESDEDIVISENIDDSVDIVIPPAGLRQGVPVADINLSWERISSIVPGRYSADIVLSLEAL